MLRSAILQLFCIDKLHLHGGNAGVSLEEHLAVKN